MRPSTWTLITFLFCFYHSARAQRELETVQSFIVGDPNEWTNQNIAFGFNAVLGISNMEKGCSITINPDAPVRTHLLCITEGSPMISVEGQLNSNEYTDIASTITAQLPIFFWTSVYSAQCKCPPGKYVAISEMVRR